MDVLFFETPDSFRKWLYENHDQLSEQWVGFYKKSTGRPSISWPESVDQALCFGWIDGIRKSIDEERYKIRFTPRKPGSHWSNVNLKKIKELSKAGMLEEAGKKAFRARKRENTAKASYEQRKVSLEPKYEQALRANSKAWDYWMSKAPGYRKQCIWWIMSAKQVTTREKRLNILIDHSAMNEVIPPFRWSKK